MFLRIPACLLFRLLILFAIFRTSYAHAQWATSVLNYHFGTSQTVGQSAAYFPANVLGSASIAATSIAPASLPQEVVSLGKGGYLALGFEQPIIDGNGPDFTVFENAFIYGDNEIFDEWMIVEVSDDGQTWFTFPYDTLTGAGMAGRTPTNGSANLLDPSVSGGDSYDLAVLGLTQAHYVRVRDATQYQSFDRLSAEVDAIAAIHQLPVSTDAVLKSVNIRWEYMNEWLAIFSNASTANTIAISDMTGKIMASWELTPFAESHFWAGNLPPGMYVLSIGDGLAAKWVKRDCGI